MGNEQRMFGGAGNPNPVDPGAWPRTGGAYRGSVIPNETPSDVRLATIARLEHELLRATREYGELHDVLRAILGDGYDMDDLRIGISFRAYQPSELKIDKWALLAAFLHRHPPTGD